MSDNRLPSKWVTEHFKVEDSKLDEAETLQAIHEAVPQTRHWTHVEGKAESEQPMLAAIQEGVLPPEGSKERFRMQSIRMIDTGQLIGFLGVYHGFPRENIFWINTLTLHPDFQGKGYGGELMNGLSDTISQLGRYTGIRTFVSLKNWPSLRLCVKAGLDKMVIVVGDKSHGNQAEAHVMLEKVL
jgi:GNAT superfamily N-acetyltransferase